MNVLASEVAIGPQVAVRLLNRVGFGPRPGDIDRILRRGIQGWAEDQLEPGPDPAVEARLAGFTNLTYSTPQVLTLYNADQRSIGPILDDLRSARVIRAAHSQKQVQEALVDFWLNHFNVNIGDGFVRYALLSWERDTVRPRVLGKFQDLLVATANDACMMYYLDNYASTVSRYDARGNLIRGTGLNENYGRELMELHTLGVTAGYTQDDVYEAARALTGWGIDNQGTSGRFRYTDTNHDKLAKNIFGLKLPAGQGKKDGDDLLVYLAHHPKTAEYICRRLAQRFVSDVPPERLVQECTSTFLATDGDISEVMRTMISSRDFWAVAFDDTQVVAKTPYQYVISALRAVDADVTSAQDVTTSLAGMGMPLYSCLPPTGWSNKGIDWLPNPGSHLQRMNFALALATNTIRGATVDLKWLKGSDARAIATSINSEIFGGGLSRSTFDAASHVTSSGTVSVASRVIGMILAGPDFQKR